MNHRRESFINRAFFRIFPKIGQRNRVFFLSLTLCMCVCVYVCMVNVCRTPPPPARPAEQYVLSAEEMTYLAARRQSELQRVEEGKAAVAAAAAKARLGWATAGGEYQAHPDIYNQGRRKNVEGNTHARARTHTSHTHRHRVPPLLAGDGSWGLKKNSVEPQPDSKGNHPLRKVDGYLG